MILDVHVVVIDEFMMTVKMMTSMILLNPLMRLAMPLTMTINSIYKDRKLCTKRHCFYTVSYAASRGI